MSSFNSSNNCAALGRMAFTSEPVVGCAGGDLALVPLDEVLSLPAEGSPLCWKISCRQRNTLREAAASWQISLEFAKQTPPKTRPLQPQLIAVISWACLVIRAEGLQKKKRNGGGNVARAARKEAH